MVGNYWEVYDSGRYSMGPELAYMGHFLSYDDARYYVEDYSHLFEGEGIIIQRSQSNGSDSEIQSTGRNV